MKKKINYYLVATALFVAIATMVSMTVINYYLFQKQVKEDLQVMAETIESTGILKQDINEIPQIDVEGIRVTWIDKDAAHYFGECFVDERCDDKHYGEQNELAVVSGKPLCEKFNWIHGCLVYTWDIARNL